MVVPQASRMAKDVLKAVVHGLRRIRTAMDIKGAGSSEEEGLQVRIEDRSHGGAAAALQHYLRADLRIARPIKEPHTERQGST